MNKTKGGKVFTWTQLLGFDKDKPDKGVKSFIDNLTFVPDGVYALVHHADFVHQYRGMEEESTSQTLRCLNHAISAITNALPLRNPASIRINSIVCLAHNF